MPPAPTPHPTVASPWVRRFLPLVAAGGRVLDLAAGAGRHVTLLRQVGYQVVAVDRDAALLQSAFAGDASCVVTEMDLEDGGPWRLGEGFDGIIVANYLHRPLLPSLAAALAPGGVLIYETFMLGNERLGKPTNPDFLLRPGELLAVFLGRLDVVAFEQGRVDQPRPAVVQRIAAVKDGISRLPA
jgi:SAM-dependent methyltransferase